MGSNWDDLLKSIDSSHDISGNMFDFELGSFEDDAEASFGAWGAAVNDFQVILGDFENEIY